MPILNGRLFVKSLLVLLVLGGGLFALHYAQSDRVPNALLWQADRAAELGKWDRAAAYMRQYLEFRPHDHDRAVQLADLVARRATGFKELSSAQFLYERVVRENPERTEIARKLVGVCLRMGRHADAMTHLDRLLKQSPKDGQLLTQLGECHAGRGEWDDAVRVYQQAIQCAPDHVRAYDQLAKIWRTQMKKPAEARALINRMVESCPREAEAYLIRARSLRAEGKHAESAADLDQVFLRDPENTEASLLLADVLQAKGDVRRTRDLLQGVIALCPRDPRAYRALSWLDLLQGNQADAVACLERAITLMPDEPELLTPLADLWVQRGQLEKARDAVGKLQSRRARSQADYVKARVAMAERRWSDALGILDSLQTDAVAAPALAAQIHLLIAACHEGRGDRDARSAALQSVFAVDPHHLPARIAAANLMLDSGRPDDAVREYAAAVKSPFAGPSVHSAYLRLMMARSAGSTDAEVLKKVDALIRKARTDHPQAIEPILAEADWLAVHGKFESAVLVLKQAAIARPDDGRLRTAWSAMADRSIGTAAAVEILDQAVGTLGDTVDLRAARARLWADDVLPGRSERIRRLEETGPGVSETERKALLTVTAECYEAIGDRDGRRRALEATAAISAGDVDVRRRLVELADTPEAAERWMEQLRRIDPAVARLLDLRLKVARGKVPVSEAAADARSAVVDTPDRVDALLLGSIVAERSGESANAVRLMERAIQRDPLDTDVRIEQFAQLARLNRHEDLRTRIAGLTRDPRFSPSRVRTLMIRLASVGNPELTRSALTAVEPAMAGEPRHLLAVARLLEDSGRMPEAVERYRNLTDRFPKFTDGWTASAIAASRIGRGEVDQVMARARRVLDTRALFTVCAESVSLIRKHQSTWLPPLETPADHKAYAQACLTSCESRGRIQDALTVIEGLAADTHAVEEDRAWARRTAAALLAAVGTPEQKRESLDRLRAENAKPVSGIDEARARVAALTAAFRNTTGEDRRRLVHDMIALLQGMTKDPAVQSSDWFQLAQLHRAIGDRPACRECLHELMRREPKNLFFTAVAIDELVSDGRLDEASKLVSRLDDGLHDVRTAASAARYWTMIGECQRAIDIVDRFMGHADAGTADGVLRGRRAAELLDQLTRLGTVRNLPGANLLQAAAVERYRASLRAYPEAIGPLASLLAFRGQVNEAFDELNRHRTGLSPTALAMAGVAVLRSGNADTKHFQLVKSWIETGGTGADAQAMLLSLAELHALRQDFNSAEQVYRDVLKTDGKNVVALNNLAWILAPRPESADQAMKLADRAIELYGPGAEILDTRARILISSGRFEKAILDLTDAINQSPSPLRYFHLALAQHKLSQSEEALKTFRQAKARGLDSKTVHPADLPVYRILDSGKGS